MRKEIVTILLDDGVTVVVKSTVTKNTVDTTISLDGEDQPSLHNTTDGFECGVAAYEWAKSKHIRLRLDAANERAAELLAGSTDIEEQDHDFAYKHNVRLQFSFDLKNDPVLNMAKIMKRYRNTDGKQLIGAYAYLMYPLLPDKCTMESIVSDGTLQTYL